VSEKGWIETDLEWKTVAVLWRNTVEAEHHSHVIFPGAMCSKGTGKSNEPTKAQKGYELVIMVIS
jgi:hypothetical protein